MTEHERTVNDPAIQAFKRFDYNHHTPITSIGQSYL